MITVDWGALVQVALVALVFGVGIVTVFSVGLLGLSRAEGESGRGASRPIGAAVAGLCALICVGAVGYGIYLIVPQFH